ncbi:hypothetical protein QJR26_09065 [Clostridium baratii]
MGNNEIFKEFLNVKEIDKDVQFWLVRSKEGIFFDEYYNNKFIALGWNYLDSKNINKKGEELEKVKDEIKRIYDTKQDTAIINKCNNFINKMKKGDIVMIPSAHNKQILFAQVGEYFECDLDYVKEVEIISRIDSKEDYGINIECPYKKRRNINIIKIIDGNRLNPNLYRALISYHGLSSIDKYGQYILSSIYNLYTWKENLNIVINVEKKYDVNAKDFSEMIYCISDILTLNDENIKVTTKSNINSPGDVILSILNQGSEFLKNHWFIIFLVWGAISGIKLGPINLGSIPDGILKILQICDYKNKRKNDELDIKLKQLEYEKKKYELNSERINSNLDKIEKTTRRLEVDRSASSNVIKINFAQKDDE